MLNQEGAKNTLEEKDKAGLEVNKLGKHALTFHHPQTGQEEVNRHLLGSFEPLLGKTGLPCVLAADHRQLWARGRVGPSPGLTLDELSGGL